MIDHRAGLGGKPGENDDHNIPDRLGNLAMSPGRHSQNERQPGAVNNGAYQDEPPHFLPETHAGHPLGPR